MRSLAFILILTPLALASEPFVPWANKFFVKDNVPDVITHDFGMVAHGAVLTHKMTITNIYDVPMQIIDVRKSCTCLEAVVPQQVLQPHDTAEITLIMNAGKFSGQNSQSFFITFGPQYVSTAVIRVSANSRTDVMLNPGNVDFGVVAQGARPTQTVSLKYSGKQRDWKVIGVASTNGPLDVQVQSNGRGGLLGLGSPEFTVQVTLKEGVPAGPIQETVALRTNDPVAPLVQFAVQGNVQAPITVSPATVNFGNVALGQAAEAKVMVRATRPFTLQPLAETPDGISIEPFPFAGQTQVVTIKFAPKAAGKLKRQIMLKSDLGEVALTIEADPQQ